MTIIELWQEKLNPNIKMPIGTKLRLSTHTVKCPKVSIM